MKLQEIVIKHRSFEKLLKMESWHFLFKMT